MEVRSKSVKEETGENLLLLVFTRAFHENVRSEVSFITGTKEGRN